MKARPSYILGIADAAKDCPTPIDVRLRQFLKTALRRFGLKVVSAEAAEPLDGDPKPEQHAIEERRTA